MPTILVVDDSNVDRRLAGGLLEKDRELRLVFAENGAEALQLMQGANLPDLVVTDLQMPEMDGLELVTAMRTRFPRIPVIIMTAHGSEEIAVQALEQGAASYVPKSQLSLKLLETAQDVLALARADRSYERLIECSTLAEFKFELDNNESHIRPLVDLVQQIVTAMHLTDHTGRLRVGMALEQALLNALYRGNLEIDAADIPGPVREIHPLVVERRRQAPYRERRIFVHICIQRQEARFFIRDEGPGFDVAASLPSSDAAAVSQERGRGLILMRTFLDEVKFNDRGNEVTLVKRKRASDR